MELSEFGTCAKKRPQFGKRKLRDPIMNLSMIFIGYTVNLGRNLSHALLTAG